MPAPYVVTPAGTQVANEVPVLVGHFLSRYSPLVPITNTATYGLNQHHMQLEKLFF